MPDKNDILNMRAKADCGPECNAEIEVKLEADPDDLARIGRLRWLRPLVQGRTTTRILRTIYFDTKDHRLRKLGMVLRVRKEGRRFIQCLKRHAPESPVSRQEWESVVPSHVPDLAHLRAVPALRGLKLEAPALLPVFETGFRRTTRTLRHPAGGHVILAVDRGEIVSGAVTTPINEIELELADGPAVAIFDLAKRFCAELPVRVSLRSKAEKGFDLAQGKAGAVWARAFPVSLPGGASAEDALAMAMVGGIRHLAANSDCVISRTHHEGVHQMRVAARRMRAVLSIFRKQSPHDVFSAIDGHLKWLIAALGPARDWDIFIDETLAPFKEMAADNPVLAETIARAEQCRNAAYADAQRCIGSATYAEAVLDIAAWLHEKPWRESASTEPVGIADIPAMDFAARTLARRHSKVEKLARRFDTMTPEERHRLRISTKKLRYAAELFASLYPAKDSKRYLKCLARLQDSLGALNDLTTAERLLQSLGADKQTGGALDVAYVSGLLDGWYGHAARRHEQKTVKALDSFTRMRPYWRQ
ncbi:MAG: CHAD domain-containing protein [Rhodospirillales bacterium]|nr:CHAD domain-containing protein [Rhodospirillales bacterium]